MVVNGSRGEVESAAERLRGEGYVRVRLDERVEELASLDLAVGRETGRSLSAIVDRLAIRDGVRARLAEAIELGYRLGDGVVEVRVRGGGNAPLPRIAHLPEPA